MNKKVLKIALIVSAVIFAIFLVISFTSRPKLPSLDYQDVNLIQLEKPKVGQEIAVINTTLGTFKVMLFRDEAPKAVEHFVELANKGYYDNKYVYEIFNGLYFFAGTTNKDGIIVDENNENRNTEMTKFDVEANKNLLPLKGSLVSLGPDKTGAGTFIAGIGTRQMNDDLNEKLDKAKNANSDIVNAFKKYGGDPYLTGQVTVFAQTYENMNVFEQIYNAAADKKNHPESEIKINKIVISKYE